MDTFPFRLIRKFVVDFMQLQMVELLLYSAFKAPKDDLFYLDFEASPEWQLLQSVTMTTKIAD